MGGKTEDWKSRSWEKRKSGRASGDRAEEQKLGGSDALKLQMKFIKPVPFSFDFLRKSNLLCDSATSSEAGER